MKTKLRLRRKVSKRFINSLVNVLYSKKAQDIKVIDTTKVTPEFDYMIISTATSKNHIDAIVSELEKFIEERKLKVIAKDTNSKTGWVVYDLTHTILHIMTQEVREYYLLERIWELPPED
ncbi:MAG: ribosome silencing factor [Brevinematia bacterium]